MSHASRPKASKAYAALPNVTPAPPTAAPSPARRRTALCGGVAGVGSMRAIFVMVKCEMGQAYRVARQMADSIDELSEMHSISGQYDLLGKFYLETDQDIGLFVVERVQSVPGVKDTYTLQTFNAFSGARG
jgi:DNA-binding Lrp family transcriptional regulator